ncbi:hypothetical protein [Aeromonas caviae]
MAADDKQNGNAKGFSGLSTLVSDVDEGSPAGQPTPQVTPPPNPAPVPESPPRQAELVCTAAVFGVLILISALNAAGNR